MITKQLIGKELLTILNKEFNIIKISRWAESIYSNHCRELTPEIDDIIMTLPVMEHGHEFKNTKDELVLLSEMLINEENNPIMKLNELKKRGSQ